MVRVGIDLGTSNSCIAVNDGRSTEIIETADKRRIMPSVVTFTADDPDPLVGQAAVNAGRSESEFCFTHVKRLMGEEWNDNEHSSPQHAEGPDHKTWLKGPGGKLYQPAQIQGWLIDAMLQAAEAKLGERPTAAVVTVPADFKDPERRATEEAARFAGLEEVTLLDEPTAAAIAYGVDADKFATIVVFDLGGGTFDISIIMAGKGRHEVVATSGNSKLGGINFDRRISGHVTSQWQAQTGVDLRERPATMSRIHVAAEAAKHDLTGQAKTVVNVPFADTAGDGVKHMNEPLTRAKFEELVRDLVDQALAICAETLKFGKVDKASIDEVILVGGMTKVPMVQAAVAAFFGKKPKHNINPDEVVAQGAAIYAASLDHLGGSASFKLVRRASHSIGLETVNNGVHVVVAKGDPVPVEKTVVLTTEADDQEVVCIKAVQGNERAADRNLPLLRRFVRVDRAPRGVPSVPVKVRVAESGIVEITTPGAAPVEAMAK